MKNYQMNLLQMPLPMRLCTALAVLLLGASFGGAASAQNAGLYPVVTQTLPLQPSILDRGMEKTSDPTLEAQQTCPQPNGDAWDLTSPQAWNILELGIQVKPAQEPKPKLQLYTRYTCNRPLDRPITSR